MREDLFKTFSGKRAKTHHEIVLFNQLFIKLGLIARQADTLRLNAVSVHLEQMHNRVDQLSFFVSDLVSKDADCTYDFIHVWHPFE